MEMAGQLTLEDTSPEYKAFLDKFKPKKTTDDCYTPENVYNAVRDYAVRRFGLQGRPIVRPFWPGGDYLRFDYPENCVVLDNPPFSILSEIINRYMDSRISFFLFCPYLTCAGLASGRLDITRTVFDADVLYENGAVVSTCFVHNMAPGIVMESEPVLREIIAKADAENRAKTRKILPKFEYPANVVTAHMLGYMSNHGTPYTLRAEDCRFIRCLDSQRESGKSLFGSGFLISDRAAAEKAAAEKAAAEKAAAEKAAAEKAAAEKAAAMKWALSEREKEIIKSLGGRKNE